MSRRRKKKKNNFKSIFNLIILLLLLFFVFILFQNFLLPILQKKDISTKESVKIEDEAEKTAIVDKEDEIEVLLYFSDDNAQYLIPENRTIKNADYNIKQIITELIKGPTNKNLFPTIPPSTKVNTVFVSDKIAYIDLSSDLIKDHPGGSTGELLTVYSIVMTLTTFPEIEKVQLLIDGNSGETLVGHLDISMPIERDEHWLK